MYLKTRFHEFYVWVLVIVGSFSVINCLMLFLASKITVSTVVTVSVSIAEIITGMLLFTRKKNGYFILRALCLTKILAAIALAVILLLALLSVFIIKYNIASIIAMLVICFAEIVCNTLVVIYYSKRKNLFR